MNVGKCRKHEPQTNLFYNSLRLPAFITVYMAKASTRFFYVLYPDKTWVFDQSVRTYLCCNKFYESDNAILAF